MSIKTSTDARAGRGAGNGGNEAWYNSPFWSNASSTKPTQEAPATVQAVQEDDSLRARQRKAFSFAY